MEFEYNISKEDAKKRVDKDYLVEVKLLDENSPEYKRLTDSEKKVLYYLCRAAFWIDKVEYQLQNKHNLDFYHFVKAKADNGDEYSKDILRLFLAQRNINSLDTNGDTINLAKGTEDKLGKNFYHFDLDYRDFHNRLSQMLEDGKVDEVKKILSARSVVEFVDNNLFAIDYVDYFKEEFEMCAKELIEASKVSENLDFKEYLTLQAEALRHADPMLDAKADMKWATLRDCKIEFTITRENYEDELTTTIFSNEELLQKLKDHNIEVNAKDSIGCRVGIVNDEGTKLLDELQGLNDIACELMPYKEEYSSKENNSNPNQVAVDVDLVAMTGDCGAYRASIVLAENLPNSDKLAIKLGGGRRNVYHRQVRSTKSSELYKKLLHPDFVDYYNLEACHWATIEHENTHSLGPKEFFVLGEYANIIEEYKADMGIYAFLDVYQDKGIFTDKQIKEIVVTELFINFSKTKPVISQAHRVRSVMITNRLISEGGIIYKDKKLSFDIDKVIATTKVMLAEACRLQLDKSAKKAKEYVEKYFIWTDIHQELADIIKENSKKLNGEVVAPLYKEAVKDLVL